MPWCGALPALGGRTDWAAFVGLDWADQKHAWSLLVNGASQYERGWVPHTPEALQEWVNRLRQRCGEGPIAICLEQSRGAVVYALSQYPQLVLFPAPPLMLARLREAFYPSGAKDDPVDSDLALMTLVQHGEQLRMLKGDTESIRRLRLLVEARRRFVDERTRQKNRLTACLKTYYPQFLQWFSDPTAVLALDFLGRWPTLQAAQRAHPGTPCRVTEHHRGGKPNSWPIRQPSSIAPFPPPTMRR